MQSGHIIILYECGEARPTAEAFDALRSEIENKTGCPIDADTLYTYERLSSGEYVLRSVENPVAGYRISSLYVDDLGADEALRVSQVANKYWRPAHVCLTAAAEKLAEAMRKAAVEFAKLRTECEDAVVEGKEYLDELPPYRYEGRQTLIVTKYVAVGEQISTILFPQLPSTYG
jgi:hypothetical protein